MAGLAGPLRNSAFLMLSDKVLDTIFLSNSHSHDNNNNFTEFIWDRHGHEVTNQHFESNASSSGWQTFSCSFSLTETSFTRWSRVFFHIRSPSTLLLSNGKYLSAGLPPCSHGPLPYHWTSPRCFLPGSLFLSLEGPCYARAAIQWLSGCHLRMCSRNRHFLLLLISSPYLTMLALSSSSPLLILFGH